MIFSSAIYGESPIIYTMFFWIILILLSLIPFALKGLLLEAERASMGFE
jgi:hypothetical protein